MRRSLITLVVVAVAVVFAAGQALAFQCPKLVAQITAATATRYDATAADVKDKVAMVQKLHSEGKHAESEQLGKELLEKLK
jgi:transcriptional regulator NrdR family protein